MLAITGAAGFIGSNLLASLEAQQDWPVLAIDALDHDAKRANVAHRQNLNWIDPDDTMVCLASKAKDVTGVVHLGAETSTTATDRAAVFANNVDASQALWTWCAENKVPFIYASSASVYGDGRQGFDDSLDLVALESLQPLNIYGESKLTFDAFVAKTVLHGDPTPPQWAGLRFFNVYGPNESHKGSQASVVSQMYPIAARGEAYRLFRSHRDGIADGEQKRDFIYVEDCVAVIRWLLNSPSVSGLFNIGTGEARSFLDLAKAVYAAADQPLSVAWRDTPEDIREHYQYFTQANISRLRTAGYDGAFTSLEEGVTMTIRDFLSQPDPYR